MRGAAYSAVLVMLAASCLDAQPGKKSQLATVTQDVDRAKIEIVYRRPVARGRELFGKLVPYGRIWTPSADSAALFTTSVDLDVNGSTLRAGRYAVWMIPDRTDWTVVFSKAQPVFHLKLPEKKTRSSASPRNPTKPITWKPSASISRWSMQIRLCSTCTGAGQLYRSESKRNKSLERNPQ